MDALDDLVVVDGAAEEAAEDGCALRFEEEEEGGVGESGSEGGVEDLRLAEEPAVL